MRKVYTFALPEDVTVEYGQVHACIEAPTDSGPCDGLEHGISDIIQKDRSAVVLGMGLRIELEKRERWVFRAETEDGSSFFDVQKLFTLPDPDNKWLAAHVVAVDQQECIAMICDMGRPPTSGHHFHVFKGNIDGSNWHRANDEPVYKGQDSFSLRWDGKQIINYATSYQNYPKRFPDNMGDHIRRVLHIRTSPDGLSWTPGGSFGVDGPLLPDDQLIVPDDQDPEETEFYKFSTFTYRGFHIGIMVKYISQPAGLPNHSPFPHGPQFSAEYWISRDGFNWLRPYARTDSRLENLPQAFTYALTPPYVTSHHMRWARAKRILEVPRNRFLGIGCRANASVITPQLRLTGDPLRLHVAFMNTQRKTGSMFNQGYVMVDLLDESKQVIPGYDGDKCSFTDTDANILTLIWNNERAQELNSGKPVHLRIRFRDARIYTLEGVEQKS